MKLKSIAIILLLTNSVALTVFSSPGDDWIIDGDTVYVDDARIYASATPHTIHQDDWVVFEVTSKVFSGDADFAWGFNTEEVKPTAIQRWTALNESNNTYHWVTWDVDYKHIKWNFNGLTDFYIIENMPIVKDTNYKVRIYIDVIGDTTGSKYWFLMKPNSESWIEARDSGHLYWLDPWIGEITQTIIDTQQVSAAGYLETSTGLCRLNTSNFFVAGYRGSGNDGYLSTFKVHSTNGSINAPAAEWEFDTGQGSHIGITQVVGSDKYLVANCDSTSSGNIECYQIWTNGTINKQVLDEVATLSNIDCTLVDGYGGLNIFRITGDLYGIVYTEAGTQDGWLETFDAWKNGSISNIKDSFEFGAANGMSPHGVMIDSDTCVIGYQAGSTTDGTFNIKTYNITSLGDIAATHADYLITGSGVWYDSTCMVKLSSDVVLGCYGDKNDKKIDIVAVQVDANGEIYTEDTLSSSASGSAPQRLTITPISLNGTYYNGVFAITSRYVGVIGNGGIRTFNTTSYGDLLNQFESYDMGIIPGFHSILRWVGNNYYVLVSDLDDGSLSARTFEIYTELPPDPLTNFAVLPAPHNYTKVGGDITTDGRKYLNVTWTPVLDACTSVRIEWNIVEDLTWEPGDYYLMVNTTNRNTYHWGPVNDGTQFYFKAWNWSEEKDEFSAGVTSMCSTWDDNYTVVWNMSVFPYNATSSESDASYIEFAYYMTSCGSWYYPTHAQGDLDIFIRRNDDDSWNKTRNDKYWESGNTYAEIFTQIGEDYVEPDSIYQVRMRVNTTFGVCAGDSELVFWNTSSQGGNVTTTWLGSTTSQYTNGSIYCQAYLLDVDDEWGEVRYRSNATGAWATEQINPEQHFNGSCYGNLTTPGFWMENIDRDSKYWWGIRYEDVNTVQQYWNWFAYRTALNYPPILNTTKLALDGFNYFPRFNHTETSLTQTLTLYAYLSDLTNDTIEVQFWGNFTTGVWHMLSSNLVLDNTTEPDHGGMYYSHTLNLLNDGRYRWSINMTDGAVWNNVSGYDGAKAIGVSPGIFFTFDGTAAVASDPGGGGGGAGPVIPETPYPGSVVYNTSGLTITQTGLVWGSIYIPWIIVVVVVFLIALIAASTQKKRRFIKR